jgi:hypothetical protein
VCIFRWSTLTGSHKLPHLRLRTPRRYLRFKINKWRCYVEGTAKITNITDHATLRHLPTQELLGRRHAIWLNCLSPYLAIDPAQTNLLWKYFTEMVHQMKDALSRRPELHDTIVRTEQKTLDKDLEDVPDFWSSMSHLQVNDAITNKYSIWICVRRYLLQVTPPRRRSLLYFQQTILIDGR